MTVEGMNHRGVWAGHCFDIVAEAKLKEAVAAGDKWHDISARARRQLLCVWKANGWDT